MRSIGSWSAQRVSLMVLSCVAAVASFASSACSLTIDPDRQQCADDSECSVMFSGGQCVAGICQGVTSGGGGSGGGGNGIVDPLNDWSCVGKPPVNTGEPGPFTINVRAASILNAATTPFAGGTAKLCTQIDINCTGAVQTTQTDSDGRFTLEKVPRNFNGFIWVTGENAALLNPSLYFFNRQPQADITETPLSVQHATADLISALTAGLGHPQKDGNGISLNNIFDCNGKAAEGVRFKLAGQDAEEMSTEAVIFYAKGSIPDATATETTTSGYGGLVNAPPGVVTLEAYVGPLEDEHKVASATFYIKPNSISIKRLVPDGT